MLRKLVLVLALAFVGGCCGRPRCNPCDRCNPCERVNPCQDPGGDSNCPVWSTWNCQTQMNGPSYAPYTRPWLLTEIRSAAMGLGVYSGALRQAVEQHFYVRNCTGNTNDGVNDCAPIGDDNCRCLMEAYAAATQAVPDWVLCLQKLQQGH